MSIKATKDERRRTNDEGQQPSSFVLRPLMARLLPTARQIHTPRCAVAEVPEVETIVRDLRETLAAEVMLEAALRFPEPGEFVAQMAGRVVLGAERRAKHILLPLSGDLTL